MGNFSGLAPPKKRGLQWNIGKREEHTSKRTREDRHNTQQEQRKGDESKALLGVPERGPSTYFYPRQHFLLWNKFGDTHFHSETWT